MPAMSFRHIISLPITIIIGSFNIFYEKDNPKDFLEYDFKIFEDWYDAFEYVEPEKLQHLRNDNLSCHFDFEDYFRQLAGVTQHKYKEIAVCLEDYYSNW